MVLKFKTALARTTAFTIENCLYLQWVAIHFSRGSSWLRDWTQVSCNAGGFFTIWVIMEAHNWYSILKFLFIYILATPHGMWALSSLAVEAWTTREICRIFILKQKTQFSQCSHPIFHPENLSFYVIISRTKHFAEWKFCQILSSIDLGHVWVWECVRNWGLWRWWGKIKVWTKWVSIGQGHGKERRQMTLPFRLTDPLCLVISRCLSLGHSCRVTERVSHPLFLLVFWGKLIWIQKLVWIQRVEQW